MLRREKNLVQKYSTDITILLHWGIWLALW